VVGWRGGKVKASLVPNWLREWEKENDYMPIYDYKCPACGCKFEVRQGYNDKTLTRCPKCKTVARRQMSIVNHKKVI